MGGWTHAHFEDAVAIQRIAFIVFVCFLLGEVAGAQRPGYQPPPPPPNIEMAPVPKTDADEAQQRMAREMAKKANLARQAALKADTDKLVQLAGELKQDVDKSTENVLSLEVLKKAEEIEKLAHSVKDKMRGAN
jgi:hypothetical protein